MNSSGAPYRIFISSPVEEIASYREQVIRTAEIAASDGVFEFYYFEKMANVPEPGESICDSIIRHAGCEFDALFLFFKDRVGVGTLAEFEYFHKKRKINPQIAIWWSQIHCEVASEEVKRIIGRLHEYGTGLPPGLPGEVLIDAPHKLSDRFTRKLIEKADQRRI